MEDSYFGVDDEEITNLHEKQDERNFMSKDLKWEYWEEVRDDEEIQGPPETDNYNGLPSTLSLEHLYVEKNIISMRYFIHMFNDKSKIIFVLGEHGAFDGGGIATRSRYCPVRMYKNINPTNIEWIF